jgi:hypothetical protein
MRLNEGYNPRAPQVGDLVKCLGCHPNGGIEFEKKGYGVVLAKQGLNIKVHWFRRDIPLWATRTSVTIKNRGAKCK